MNKLLTILLLFATLGLGAQTEVSFVKEKIDFSISPSNFKVNGIYYFVNQTDHDKTQGIGFPFAQHADSVQILHVIDLQNLHSIPFRPKDSAIYFSIHIPAKDTFMLGLAYSQPTALHNEYVLKSTQSWGKPLEYADYSLELTEAVRLKQVNIPYDRKEEGIYFWHKQQFYPNENIIFELMP